MDKVHNYIQGVGPVYRKLVNAVVSVISQIQAHKLHHHPHHCARENSCNILLFKQ